MKNNWMKFFKHIGTTAIYFYFLLLKCLFNDRQKNAQQMRTCPPIIFFSKKQKKRSLYKKKRKWRSDKGAHASHIRTAKILCYTTECPPAASSLRVNRCISYTYNIEERLAISRPSLKLGHEKRASRTRHRARLSVSEYVLMYQELSVGGDLLRRK